MTRLPGCVSCAPHCPSPPSGRLPVQRLHRLDHSVLGHLLLANLLLAQLLLGHPLLDHIDLDYHPLLDQLCINQAFLQTLNLWPLLYQHLIPLCFQVMFTPCCSSLFKFAFISAAPPNHFDCFSVGIKSILSLLCLNFGAPGSLHLLR